MSYQYQQQEFNKGYIPSSQHSFSNSQKNTNPYSYIQQPPPSQANMLTSYGYQPATAAGDTQKTYFQPIQYVTQTGRQVQRTTSPMVLQHPRYQASAGNSPNPYIPNYLGAGTYSAEKNIPSTAGDGSNRSPYLQNTYTSQQTSYNNTTRLRSPYISNFNHHISAEQSQPTQIIVQEPPKSNNYTIAYQQIQLLDQRGVVPILPQKSLEYGKNYQNNGLSGRAYSVTRADTYQTPPQSNQQQGEKGESFSPSKRVTFNLAKNTYTNVEQIEKRLNDQNRLREQQENIPIVDDLNLRFDSAINRSERIINDFSRIGREGGYQKQISLESGSSNATTNISSVQNTPTKIIGRSKSPIKPSLKRTSSFTNSPQKIPQTPPISQSKYEANLAGSPLTNQTNKIMNASEAVIPPAGDTIKVHSHLDDIKSSLSLSSNKIPAYAPFYNPKERMSSSLYLGTSKPDQQNSISIYDENTKAGYQRAVTPPKFSANPSLYGVQNQQTSITKSQQQPKETNIILNQASKENEIQQSVKSHDKINPTQHNSTSESSTRKGVLRYSDGSRYNGTILNNKRNGYGTLMSDNFQVIYQGEWQNDTYHGQGKFFNPLAQNLQDDYDYSDFDIALSSYWESYEGEFFEGKLDGKGTLMLTNGERLVGNFKKGRINGKGTFHCSKQTTITGNWEDNRLISKS